jgi:peptidoglycan/LPS O-acetylase OafA/YrhL
MKPADSHDYRPDIDGLRAVAVLAVVAYHAFPHRLPGGFVGVDVFFVISGFLITSIILRGVEAGRFSFVEFYARRVRRIFPALIVILAFCFAAGWFELWTREFRQLGKHIFAAMGFASNFVLWKETGYFDARAETKPLLHLWSLGIEEQFYLVWPLLVWGAYRLRRSVAPLIVAVLLSSFALSIWWVTREPGAAFFLPLPRFWELMVGCGLAWAALHRGLPKPGVRAELLSVAGLGAIGAAMLMLRPESAFPGWWALLPTLGAMLVIAAGPETRLNKHVLSQPAVVFIGLISYPLYLWHWPILTFLRMSRLEPLSTPLRLAAVGASIGLAWLTYRFVELPIRSSRPRRLAPALCGALASVGMVGFALAWSNGLPWRFPASLRRLD